MRKLALVTMVMVMTVPTQASAAGCTMANDPTGDVSRAATAPPPTDTRLIDLTTVIMSTTGQSIVVEAGVVDVEGALNGASNVVSIETRWAVGNQAYGTLARRQSSQWTFWWTHGVGSGPQVGTSNGVVGYSDPEAFPAVGSIDVAHDTIRVEFPRSAIGSPPNGTELIHVNTSSSERDQTRPALQLLYSDQAPGGNDTSWPNYTLGQACA